MHAFVNHTFIIQPVLHVSALSAFDETGVRGENALQTKLVPSLCLFRPSVRPFSCNNSSTPTRIFVKCQLLTSSSMSKLPTQLEVKWDVQNLRLEMQCYIHTYNDEGCPIVMQLWIKAEDGSCKTLLQCPSVPEEVPAQCTLFVQLSSVP